MESQGSTSNCNTEAGDEMEIEDKQTGFDDLPAEMVNEIFKKLKVSSLLNCRLVDRRLNTISIDLLKAQTKIRFDSRHGEIIRTLQDFTRCFKNSKSFPSDRYFLQLHHTFLTAHTVERFFSCCENNIKSLKLELRHLECKKNIIDLTMEVGDLLLKTLPNIQEFGLQLNTNFELKDTSQYKLFPKIKKGQGKVQLPQLKVLYISFLQLQTFPRIAEDLLVAAVNLKKIEPFYADYHAASTRGSFKLLHSLGKLHLLMVAKIIPSVELFSWMESSIQLGNPVVFKLSKLILAKSNNLMNVGPGRYNRYDMQIYKPPAGPEITKFINLLFDSIKDTLKEIVVDHLGLLDNLPNSKFTILKKFSYRGKDTCNLGIQYVNAENFPALRELDISKLSCEFPEEEWSQAIPTMRTLRVAASSLIGTSIENISNMCPNLIDLEIKGCLANFPAVGSSIWTHMTTLQSLIVKLEIDSENSLVAVESTFTGISLENCQRLLNKIKAMKKPQPLSQKLIAEKSLMINASELRENASILDLQELKKLKINYKVGQHFNPSHKKYIFELSKTSTFDLMPNLTVMFY